ncbi:MULTISPECIES: hypothetical protein [Pseudomonas]|uniref:hypothetical protein n=1 Tax=Pseudomonas TaxID=286 RepID=UPI000B0AC7BD|nr:MULTISPECIES: hypothetical protein [Pseudomonas]MCL8332475.1 hypothetical protein [Pseudomonas juntendi]MDM1714225.1 hypothetical protein [Pseudomonas sp. 165]MDM3890582.1 hypothetical protein [Pseudomonas juntendi]QDR68352.1 hypothetical protein FPB55_12160 [Pseudomonas sp. BJP69]
MGTLRNRALAYASGQTIEFGGRAWPALYTPKNQTLIDIFGITDAEQQQLRTIITPALATERDTVRQREKRRASGVLERAQYEQNRQQKTMDRAAQIKAMKAEGKSASEIAKELQQALDLVVAIGAGVGIEQLAQPAQQPRALPWKGRLPAQQLLEASGAVIAHGVENLGPVSYYAACHSRPGWSPSPMGHGGHKPHDWASRRSFRGPRLNINAVIGTWCAREREL